MNAPITHSDDLVRGEDQQIAFTVRDNAGSPVNITGWAIRWRLLGGPNGNALISKTVGSGIAISDGPSGSLIVTVNAADTASLPASRELFHDLWRTDSGSAQRLASGSVVLQ